MPTLSSSFSYHQNAKNPSTFQHLQRLNDVTTQGQVANTPDEAKILKKLIKTFIRDTNNAIEVPLSVQSLSDWEHFLQGQVENSIAKRKIASELFRQSHARRKADAKVIFRSSSRGTHYDTFTKRLYKHSDGGHHYFKLYGSLVPTAYVLK